LSRNNGVSHHDACAITLRMTLGKASPSISLAAMKRMPFGARVLFDTRAR
jgi:hypothetical protein